MKRWCFWSAGALTESALRQSTGLSADVISLRHEA
jgi:hypothetical protein